MVSHLLFGFSLVFAMGEWGLASPKLLGQVERGPVRANGPPSFLYAHFDKYFSCILTHAPCVVCSADGSPQWVRGTFWPDLPRAGVA